MRQSVVVRFRKRTMKNMVLHRQTIQKGSSGSDFDFTERQILPRLQMEKDPESMSRTGTGEAARETE